MTPLLQSIAEPVAWQMRFQSATSWIVGWSDWETFNSKEALDAKAAWMSKGNGVEVETRPLYAHPPQAQAVVTEEMVAIARDAEQQHNDKFPAGPGWDALQNNRIRAILVAALNAPPTAHEPTSAEVERVARAICAEDCDGNPDALGRFSGRPMWHGYEAQARAAIAAMRSEP